MNLGPPGSSLQRLVAGHTGLSAHFVIGDTNNAIVNVADAEKFNY